MEPIFNHSECHIGFQVKIGEVRAFLPNTYSMKKGSEQPQINIRIAVINIDPITKKITVSVTAAYQILFDDQPLPEVGEECRGLFWDYDQKYVYLLLPGEYLGIAHRGQCEQKEMEECMGNITRCRVKRLSSKEREAFVEILL